MDYESMDVNELRGLLKDRGLNPFGQKADLVKRAMASSASEEKEESPASKPIAKKRKRK